MGRALMLEALRVREADRPRWEGGMLSASLGSVGIVNASRPRSAITLWLASPQLALAGRVSLGRGDRRHSSAARKCVRSTTALARARALRLVLVSDREGAALTSSSAPASVPGGRGHFVARVSSDWHGRLGRRSLLRPIRAALGVSAQPRCRTGLDRWTTCG